MKELFFNFAILTLQFISIIVFIGALLIILFHDPSGGDGGGN
jgi:hypothetical protein